MHHLVFVASSLSSEDLEALLWYLTMHLISRLIELHVTVG